jgi:hypothetical protein
MGIGLSLNLFLGYNFVDISVLTCYRYCDEGTSLVRRCPFTPNRVITWKGYALFSNTTKTKYILILYNYASFVFG